MTKSKQLLILGGTTEARELAERLASNPQLEIVYSLAGRTREPEFPPAETRLGGFGGAEGLETYLREQGIGLVIDATHPFAANVSRHAREACAKAGLPRLTLTRPAWRPEPGDNWTEVGDTAEAAGLVRKNYRRVFVTLGRLELDAFAGIPEVWFLVRMIEPGATPAPLANWEQVLQRGPFDREAEKELMTRHGIEALVAKNSGGRATYGKIEAARALGLPIVILRRPPPEPGETVESVEEAEAWVSAHLGA